MQCYCLGRWARSPGGEEQAGHLDQKANPRGKGTTLGGKTCSRAAPKLVDKATIVRVSCAGRTQKYRPSGPKMPPSPGFRPSMRPVSRTMRPCEEIANTPIGTALETASFRLDRRQRPRGSTMRSSSINVPRSVPSNSKLSNAPKPSPFCTGRFVKQEAAKTQQSSAIPRPPRGETRYL